MQNNGFKIALTVFFVTLCGWYLYPSVQNLYTSYKMNSMSPEERQEYQQENYAWLQQVDQNSLKLGLDLLGGMHVTMEVETGALIGQLADDRDETFNRALSAAQRRVEQNDGVNVIDAFVEEFEAQSPDARLSRYFRSEEANITRRSGNSEVVEYLRQQADEAVTRAIEIIRNRVDRYGVTEPNIQRQGERRIVVELPGVEDEQRIRELLKSTARLQFRLMPDPQTLASSIQEIVQFYDAAADTMQVAADTAASGDGAGATGPSGTSLTAGSDTADTQQGTSLTQAGPDTSQQGTALSGEEEQVAQNPLLAVMQPLPYQRQGQNQRPIVGRVNAQDTSRVNELLAHPQVKRLLPSGTELMYRANPIGQTESGQEVYEIVGVQSEVEMSGEVVTEASVQFDQRTNEPQVSMTMDSEGSRIWSRVTGANVGEPVAIVLDGVVYSAPTVQQRITGGRSEISGLESRQEASDIVTVLQSGAFQAPVEIVGQRSVGPSLGEASIRAGFTSVVVGLLLVALFMIMYYRSGGIVADLALLLNVILILGILAGFKATLTLPGIAGIVLTIGMAVDANVLIFERIREEQSTGKTLQASINAGYERALSAILDANITTFFVGAILYSFGVGPIQGFAVTLMAGILSSLFTAIIVTRVVFDYVVGERQMTVSYG
jgi:preprotein translocase subunit SecD